ncbi:MAG TPA: hypothetical protein PLW72_15435 [Burkholderiaceae bacterium]|nr:hypothetical protein [Burkholderiaceae bacterium]HQR77674.1 hypothetical protein [Burkholderiaceae bacterium]
MPGEVGSLPRAEADRTNPAVVMAGVPVFALARADEAFAAAGSGWMQVGPSCISSRARLALRLD